MTEFPSIPDTTGLATLPVDSPPTSALSPLSIDPQTAIENRVSSQVAELRSFKAYYGLGDILQKSRSDIYDGMVNGDEPAMRQQAAATINSRKIQATEDAIQKYAQNKGGALSIGDVDYLHNAIDSMKQQEDPNSIFETAYSREYFRALDRSGERNQSTFLLQAKDTNPAQTEQAMQAGQMVMSQREFAQKLYDQADDAEQRQGWGGYTWDIAKGFIPGNLDYTYRGINPEVGKLSGGLLLGTNMEEQAKNVMMTPDFKTFTQRAQGMFDQVMSSSGPSAAKTFAHTLMGMSTSDVYLNNVLPLADYATFGSAAKGAVTGVKSALGLGLKQDVNRGVRTMLKAVENAEPSPGNILAATGDNVQAGILKATSSLVLNDVEKQSAEALTSDMQAALAQRAAAPGRGGQELVNRILESAQNRMTNFLDLVAGVQKVERLPEMLASETATRVLNEEVKGQFPWMSGRIQDVLPAFKDRISNTWYKPVVIGDEDGAYFFSRQTAENFAERYGLDKNAIKATDKEVALGPTESISKEEVARREEELARMADDGGSIPDKPYIKQQGVGFYIQKNIPIDETTGRIRTLIEDEANRPGSKTYTPNNFVNAIAGWFRTPEDTLSLANRQNRLISTVSPSAYIDFMQENAKDIRALVGWRNLGNKQRWNDFSRIIKLGTELPDKNGLRGRFFESPHELEEAYQTHIGRLPDEKEVRAYFAFSDAMEFDRMFRNIAEHRNQLRLGVQSHEIFTLGEDGKARAGSGTFSAVERNHLPGGVGNIAIMGNKIGEEKVMSLQHMDTTMRNTIKDGLNDGTIRILEVYAPENKPLKGFGNIGDVRVRYVAARQVEDNPLEWNHIPQRGGGHIVYDYDHYLKQAMIEKETVGSQVQHIYTGDKTVAAVGIRALGNDFAKKLNDVRGLIKDGNLVAAQEYTEQHLHVSWPKVRDWFVESRNEQGQIIRPALNLDEPVMVVPKGKQISQLDNSLENRYENFFDGTRSGSLSRQFQVEFSGQRDAEGLQALVDKGSKANPLYAMEDAAIVDPIAMMNRALTRIVHTNTMDDYKIFAVEHWIAEAKPYLEDGATVQHSPFWHFNNPIWKSGAKGSEIVRQLETQQKQILSLVGTPSATDSFLNSAAQKLMDATYNRFGMKGILLDPKTVLPILKDPARFIRSVVFHTTLGMFNLPQFLVQSMNYVNILGIAGPRYAMSGSLAAQLHFWSSINADTKIIAHLDTMASKFRMPGVAEWKPGEFTEARNEMMKTGWGNIGREVSTLDDVASEKLINNLGKDFLDAGGIFFRGGERNARYGAWYTAFKEWRDKNPTAILGDADRADILTRADTLNINMTRASSSMLHQGVLSIPTQFYAYQLRLTELLLSKRLTNIEKIRLVGANAAMYGIPTGLGVTGIPFTDNLRKYALENGYVVGDNFLTSLAMEGIPSSLLALTTGNWYNVADRYGNKGFDQITSVQRTDKSMLDILGGAAYSKLKDAWGSTDGFRAAIMSAFRDDGKFFPVTIEDMSDIFRGISSVNQGMRLAAAVNIGKWMSRKDTYLTDVTPMNAIFQSITGMQSQNVADVTRKTTSLQDQKALYEEAEKQFTQEFQRFAQAHKDNDPDAARKSMIRGLAWLNIAGYPRDKFMSLVSRAAGNNRSLVDSVDWSFYIQNAPDDSQVQRMKAFQTVQRQKQVSENNK